METTSAKATDENLELEDLWSELNALKKLYALLHSSSETTSNADGNGTLDENSRLVLKKLLDDATHQALQSQAEIVCNHPSAKSEKKEAKIPTNEEAKIPTDKEAYNSEKFQKCHPITSSEVKTSEETPTTKVAIPSEVKEQPELTKSGLNPSITINKGRVLTRQSSHKSTTSRRHQHHHREPKLRTNKDAEAIGVPEGLLSRTKPVTNSDQFAIVPAEKRARVEAVTTGPLALPPPSFSIPRTRIVGQADRDLTHSKRREPGVNNGTRRSEKKRDQDGPSKPPSRVGSLRVKDRGKSKPASHRSLEKRPSQEPDKSQRKMTGGASAVVGAPTPRIPARLKSIGCKSMSQQRSDSTSGSSIRSRSRSRRVGATHRKQQQNVLEEKPLRRILTSQRTGGPTRHRKQPPPPPRPVEKKGEGRLQTLKNKLAIIFHHHHHHHIHDGHVDTVVKHEGPISKEQHHRSPWTYLRSVLHHASGDDRSGSNNTKVVAKASKHVTQQQQHGYFYALLEGLVRHVWGMSRQKKARARHNELGKSAKRKGSKKLHWWQRFRRWGGVKLTHKKTPRLRLGFGRIHSRTTRNRDRKKNI